MHVYATRLCVNKLSSLCNTAVVVHLLSVTVYIYFQFGGFVSYCIYKYIWITYYGDCC